MNIIHKIFSTLFTVIFVVTVIAVSLQILIWLFPYIFNITIIAGGFILFFILLNMLLCKDNNRVQRFVGHYLV